MLVVARAAIGLLTGPFGKVILAGVAFFAWTAYVHYDARAACEDNHLRTELEETNRLLIEANQLVEEGAARAASREQELRELKEKADDLKRSIPQGDACVLSDDTRQRLLDIK